MSTYLERTYRLQALLTEQPLTYDELVVASGLNKPVIAAWVKAMRAMPASPLVVARWAKAKDGRPIVPVFRWSPGASDAPRPGPVLTPAERMRELRARQALR